MMRGITTWTRSSLGLAVLCAALATCGQGAPSRSATTSRPTATPTVNLSSPTPVGTPQATLTPGPPTTLVVTQVGASASAQGLTAVALIRNPSPTTGAVGITVTFTAVSANGRAPLKATAALHGLAPSESQGVTAVLHPTSGDSIADVTADAAATASQPWPVAPLQVGSPQFQSSAYTPAASLAVGNLATSPQTVTVVVACFDRAGQVTGGGESDRVALAAQQTVSVTVSLAVPSIPDHCQGFARPS